LTFIIKIFKYILDTFKYILDTLVGDNLRSLVFYLLFYVMMTSSVLMDVRQADFNIKFFILSFSIKFLFLLFNALNSSSKVSLALQLFKLFLCSLIFISGFAMFYQNEGILRPDQTLTNIGKDCLYFSIVTWTTLGYGDFQPTEGARVFAGIQAMLGTFFTPLYLVVVIKQLEYNKQINKD